MEVKLERLKQQEKQYNRGSNQVRASHQLNQSVIDIFFLENLKEPFIVDIYLHQNNQRIPIFKI